MIVASRSMVSAAAPAPEPPGDGLPRHPEQLRLEALHQRAKPRIGLKMLDVRHPVEAGNIENEHREDHLRVAPPLGRAAARAWETDQNALRRQHLEQQHQTAAGRRRRARDRCRMAVPVILTDPAVRSGRASRPSRSRSDPISRHSPPRSTSPPGPGTAPPAWIIAHDALSGTGRLRRFHRGPRSPTRHRQAR